MIRDTSNQDLTLAEAAEPRAWRRWLLAGLAALAAIGLGVAGVQRWGLGERSVDRDRVRIAVVVRANDPDSGRSAAQALKALAETDDLEGLPLDRVSTTYTEAATLARFIREGNVSILYVTPGFSEGEIEAMTRALDGVSVLSVGALAKYSPLGMVLGFDLAGGKPKLIVNLGRAKRQNVELSSSVLKLVRVIE